MFKNATDAKSATGSRFEPTAEQDVLASRVLDGAFAVHKELGPGLLESVYEVCLCDVLTGYGLSVEKQKPIPVRFKGRFLETGFRADLVVNDALIVELKSIEKITSVHEAQMTSYLRLSGISLGLLINFNVPLLKQGIKRFVCSEARGALGVRGV